jgi:hypothetical protein
MVSCVVFTDVTDQLSTSRTLCCAGCVYGLERALPAASGGRLEATVSCLMFGEVTDRSQIDCAVSVVLSCAGRGMEQALPVYLAQRA